jgi:hypothetical protein
MADLILFFGSNADTMIPRPASVDTPSNLCLSIDGGVESQAKSALSGAGVPLGGIVK